MKSILVSSNNGLTWNSLPSSSSDFGIEAEGIESTVFGDRFRSKTKGLKSWSSNTNVIYKNAVGYKTKLLKQNGSLPFYNVPTTKVANNTFELAGQPLIEEVTAVMVDGVPTSNYTVNHLLGSVTVEAEGGVTVSGSTCIFSDIEGVTSFNLSLSAETINTSYLNRKNRENEYTDYRQGIKTVEFSVDTINSGYDWDYYIESRDKFVVEVQVGVSKARGYFKLRSVGNTLGIDDNEVQSLNFTLYAPTTQDGFFAWLHPPLPTSITTLIAAWETDKYLYLQYKKDGNIIQGKAFPSSITISGSISSMLEIDVTFRGTGAYDLLTDNLEDENESMAYSFISVAAGENYTASNNEYIGANTALGSWNLYLPPTPLLGDQAGCFDVNLVWGLYPLTVYGNGNNIVGNSSLTLDQKGGNMTFVFDGNEWKVSRRS